MSKALLPLRRAGQWMVVEAEQVQDILGVVTWVPIPGAPSALPGVLPWRGRAIAVLDVGAATGAFAALAANAPAARNVVVHAANVTVAIPVEAVQEVQQVSDDAVTPRQLTTMQHCSREVQVQGVPMPLLDLGALLSSLVGRGEGA
ncbi:MAG: chemotaxis protein CheW [Myxococcota bacterium]